MVQAGRIEAWGEWADGTDETLITMARTETLITMARRQRSQATIPLTFNGHGPVLHQRASIVDGTDETLITITMARRQRSQATIPLTFNGPVLHQRASIVGNARRQRYL